MMALEDSQAKVVIENKTESFNVAVGVGQGDALSVIRFNLVLDYIIKKLATRGRILTEVVQINTYTDGVVIMSRNLKALEEALQELDNTTQKIGLIVSEDSTK
jgi:hypothetical protein